jgi:predicted DCC family thiol-disulfide oxidoreductase YuxK
MYWVAQWFSFGWVHYLHPPLLFSMIVLSLSPSGARLSVDHLLKRLRENHAAQQFIPKITAPRGLTKFAVLFDGQCPLCIRSVTTVDFLDWRGKFVFRDVNDWEQISRDYPGLDQQKSLEEMQVMIPRDGGHEALAGFYAFRKIAQHLPLGMLIWPFMYIPGVPFLGARVYHFVASRRKRITSGARCSFHTCEIPAPVNAD